MEIPADDFLQCLASDENNRTNIEDFGFIYHVTAAETDCGLLKVSIFYVSESKNELKSRPSSSNVSTI